MTGEALARFLELRGWKVVQAAGAFWQEFRERSYMSFPHQVVLSPDPAELDAMLRSSKALCVRYASAQPHGLAGGLFVVRDKNYGLASVQARARSKVRRGLERCEIRPVDLDILQREGLQLNLDTMARQERSEAEFGEAKRWTRLIEAIRQSPTISVTGAFVDGRLSAYAIVHREDRWVHLLYQMSRTADLQHYPNYALHYHVSREIADADVEAMCSGPLSLMEGGGLRDFKLRMGMEVLPQTFAFRFHPAISRMAASGVAGTVAEGLRRLRPKNARLEVLANVLRGARLSRPPVNGAGEVAPC
jgi:hypothetical protein